FAHKIVANKRHFIIISFLLVFFSPYYLEVYMGNTSFITGTLLLVAFYFYRQQEFKKFFIIFIMSILIKPIGLLFLPLLFFDKQKKMVVIALVIIIGLALPYFLMHPGDWVNFVRVNFDGYAAQPGFLVHAGNQGFYALMLTISTHLHHLPNSKLYTLYQLPWWNDFLIRAIPYVFVLLSLWLTYRLRKSKQLELLIFLWVATYLLGYKDIWEHTYSLLIFGLLFLYLSKAINPRLLLICSVAIALPTAFAFYDITFFHGAFNDPDWHWGFATSLIHHATKPIWVLVLYVACLIQGFGKLSYRKIME
ncbi:MAG: DUF2029 domain-containing protein, partial [FCB group bacterium]|nr:DUF2029 domain-containing protein [FCB group bacterium]